MLAGQRQEVRQFKFTNNIYLIILTQTKATKNDFHNRTAKKLLEGVPKKAPATWEELLNTEIPDCYKRLANGTPFLRYMQIKKILFQNFNSF